jgi:arginase
LQSITQTLQTKKPQKVVCVGGGCGLEVSIVSYLKGIYNELQLYWIDAHGDLNSSASSPSKYFYGMSLRYLTEQQKDLIGEDIEIIKTEDICLIGTRDLDVPEKEYIKKHAIKVIQLGENYWADLYKTTKRCKPAYIHIDLDVIDPNEYKNVKCPVKHGIKINELAETIRYIRSKMDVVGMSLLENIETKQMEIKSIESIVSQALGI